MAARSVFKLFSKTCAYSLHTPTIPSLCPDKCRKRQLRSCSQTRHCHFESAGERLFQLRKISKSLVNLRESRYKEEDFEEQEPSRNAFPPATDVTIRDPAKEFKNELVFEEKNEEGNPIYELAECSRSEENVYDVLNFMRKQQDAQATTLFRHLQPSNLKPYGSNENLHYPQINRKRIKIVYPNPSTGFVDAKKKKGHHKEFSTQSGTKIVQKEYPGYEETKKLAVCESKSKGLMKMNYSTVSTKKPRRTVNSSCFTRPSSTALLKKKNKKRVEEIIADCTEKLNELQAKNENIRSYNTHTKPESTSNDYITVKLGDLKEECRRENRCKPKKISFGRLPKVPAPDCPCFEDIPLKEGKPLVRLKKRFKIKDRDNTCKEASKCPTERADDNYVIKKKTLKTIEAKDCPCEEREMTDFVIKRLPKKIVPEPPRVCDPCVEKTLDCCPPRADAKLLVQPKKLPKLQANDCPCIEALPFKDIPLKKLVAKPVKEPERVCYVDDTCRLPRADDGLKVEKKILPQIEGDCVCQEQPPLKKAPPLVRLRKAKYVEKPRQSCEVEICDFAVRADDGKKIEAKKLPLFVPRTCPCVDSEPPALSVKLKRLVKKTIKEPEKVCKVEECGSRADDGLQVKPKRLPTIELKECPCTERVVEDVPPLRRLVPVPIPEPPRVCESKDICLTAERSDDHLKIEAKKLPALPAGDCPCVESPLPKEGKPLRKLKKKPVAVTKVCEVKKEECMARADEGLKVKAKKLPKLQINDCPCIEGAPPEDVPLVRLRKVNVPEPARVCPKEICHEIPRSDEDDWLYWKRVEVKPTTRNFSTSARRRYSTSTKMEEDLFKIKYDIPRFPPGRLNNQAYNIIIDIKPSSPLILTQKPVDLNQLEGLESSFGRKKLKRSKSEPVDCVTFVIYKSNSLGGGNKSLREGSSDVSLVFNTINRFISTCSSLYEDDKNKLKDHVTPQCECPPNDRYLQPKHPIIPEKEHFISPFPDDDFIEYAAKKGRRIGRKRKDEKKTTEGETLKCVSEQKEKEEDFESCMVDADEPSAQQQVDKKLTLWERIVNYFKARPNCPTPEEFKKIRMKEQAEKAASKAGLCIYDPKEMLHRNEKDLPKVITAGSLREEEEEQCSK